MLLRWLQDLMAQDVGLARTAGFWGRGWKYSPMNVHRILGPWMEIFAYERIGFGAMDCNFR